MKKQSQQFVDIEEIRDGVIILKDGTLRKLIMLSSINLALKSADEQTAILTQFQQFLNTLEFSTQIVVQSRYLDIGPYVEKLRERERVLDEHLLKVQVREYIEFIKMFTENTNVMVKSFFIVVSYTGIVAPPKGGNPLKGLLSIFTGNKNGEFDRSSFERKRSQLEERTSVVEQGLSRIGIKVQPLNTEQQIELFYDIYNPGESKRKPKIN